MGLFDLFKKEKLYDKITAFTDPRDKNVYKVVKIGNQIWMAENLAYIPHLSPSVEQGGIWVYNYQGNDINVATQTEKYNKFGCLYDWETVINKNKNIFPTGWHLPTKEEFETLLKKVSSEGENAYNKLVYGGSSGFNAIFGGWRTNSGYFDDIWTNANFWSSSDKNEGYAWNLCFYLNDKNVFINCSDKNLGFSVRCIKD